MSRIILVPVVFLLTFTSVATAQQPAQVPGAPIQFQQLSPDQIQNLFPVHIQTLSPDQIQKLSLAQMGFVQVGISPQQLESWRKSGIVSAREAALFKKWAPNLNWREGLMVTFGVATRESVKALDAKVDKLAEDVANLSGKLDALLARMEQ